MTYWIITAAVWATVVAVVGYSIMRAAADADARIDGMGGQR